MDVQVAVVPDGDAFTGLCGAQGCNYMSRAWPSHEIATERILQHKKEHDTGELMEDLLTFRDRHQLVVIQGSPKAHFPEGAVIVGGLVADAPVVTTSEE